MLIMLPLKWMNMIELRTFYVWKFKLQVLLVRPILGLKNL